MQNFGKILGTFILVGALAAPLSAFAVAPAFLPFGGRVASVPIPCLSPMGPAVWVSIVPFGLPGTIPPALIVTLPTLGSLVPPVPTKPPLYPLQQILGTYNPALVLSKCVTPAGVSLFGSQTITENTEFVGI